MDNRKPIIPNEPSVDISSIDRQTEFSTVSFWQRIGQPDITLIASRLGINHAMSDSMRNGNLDEI